MKRITLFAGHYGSGKTSIAVSYAKYLKSMGKDTAIVDLDIVNPYFRTKDSEKELEKLGISIVSSEYANTNLDAPALPKEIYKVIANKNLNLVIDVGGDDRGAVALGRFADDIMEDSDFDMYFVSNFYRPLTKTAEEAFEVMREIEDAGHIPFTGIINNSNLGNASEFNTLVAKNEEAERLSKLSNLPIVFSAITEEFYKEDDPKMFKIELQDKYYEIEKGEDKNG